MNKGAVVSPKQIIHILINKNGLFPNNSLLPLLIYKKALILPNESPEVVEEVFTKNNWKNSWRNGIYPYHHYHSNTHEVIGVYAGSCDVEFGGPNGTLVTIEVGDMILIPAGVSHKNSGSTNDFKCVGSYPSEKEYDMHYGKEGDHPKVDNNIKNVSLPKCDPIYGSKGPLFDYWK
jgi:uncharacterized protein YjlB